MSQSKREAVVTHPSERELRVERLFGAARERVWRAMTDPKQVAQWWGRGNMLVVERLQVERGGYWRFVEHAEDGVHAFEGRFRKVSPLECMVQTFEWDGMPGHVIVNTTTLEDMQDGRTKVVTTSLFHTREERDGMASSKMAEGLNQSYRALDTLLAREPDAGTGTAIQTPEQEVRAMFAQWFADTARQDLDALMSKIADDAVSYEHDAPLQHLGVAAIREVCRRGFELSPGEVHWDVPDLKVLVQGDLAVTWGLNRMYGQGPDGARFESWSRGTRIFQKRDGRWQMIHEHVSFPYDPVTGQAKTDLRP